ncbi:hypothetical protein MRB53_013162 [Persea americana]|uniref:Uncharacterized protein n=1 Tax=Persea americana TaxID=3435 RepID=A0ACC2K7A5_PERAE|nr:hypothetical protein MRB53_013162 [Persea americana]
MPSMKDVLMHVRRSLIVVEEGFRSLVQQILSPFLLWLWVIPKNYQVPRTGSLNDTLTASLVSLDETLNETHFSGVSSPTSSRLLSSSVPSVNIIGETVLVVESYLVPTRNPCSLLSLLSLLSDEKRGKRVKVLNPCRTQRLKLCHNACSKSDLSVQPENVRDVINKLEKVMGQ